ncbi:unnamed protein product [Amoebophrya sp. A120]|nr:unnamed protein product [Amoebophrya sp. A120]|eukprot:GSA120T00017547001.1
MFGSGVKLGDLSDYLETNQECIQPLLNASTGKISNEKGSTNAVYDLSRGLATEKPNLIKSAPGAGPATASKAERNPAEDSTEGAGTSKKAKAVVALSDCLACSGCVTSAEAVLLETQSFDKFLSILNASRSSSSSSVSSSNLQQNARWQELPASRSGALPHATPGWRFGPSPLVPPQQPGLDVTSPQLQIGGSSSSTARKTEIFTGGLDKSAAGAGAEDIVLVSLSPESLVNVHLKWNPHGGLVQTLGKLQFLFSYHASNPVFVTDTRIAHGVYLREVFRELLESGRRTDHDRTHSGRAQPMANVTPSVDVVKMREDKKKRSEVDNPHLAQQPADDRVRVPGEGGTKKQSQQTIIEQFDAKVEAAAARAGEGTQSRDQLRQGSAQQVAKPVGPIVASYCPGWTCYAEKVAPPAVVPHLSQIRNPLVLQGHLGKQLFRSRAFFGFYRSCFHFDTAATAVVGNLMRPYGPPPFNNAALGLSFGQKLSREPGILKRPALRNLQHVVIAPCFDRKIESMRPEFRDTLDLVLATRELEKFLEPEALPDDFSRIARRLLRDPARQSRVVDLLACSDATGNCNLKALWRGHGDSLDAHGPFFTKLRRWLAHLWTFFNSSLAENDDTSCNHTSASRQEPNRNVIEGGQTKKRHLAGDSPRGKLHALFSNGLALCGLLAPGTAASSFAGDCEAPSTRENKDYRAASSPPRSWIDFCLPSAVTRPWRAMRDQERRLDFIRTEFASLSEDEQLARLFFHVLPALPVEDVTGRTITEVKRHLLLDEALALHHAIKRETTAAAIAMPEAALPESEFLVSGGGSASYSEEEKDPAASYRPLRQDPLLAKYGSTLRASGFKNIQNVVSKLVSSSASSLAASTKPKKDDIRFIDVAACPSGCLNGGGQFPLELDRMQAFWRGLPWDDQLLQPDEGNFDTGGGVYYKSLRARDGEDEVTFDRGKAAPTLKW